MSVIIYRDFNCPRCCLASLFRAIRVEGRHISSACEVRRMITGITWPAFPSRRAPACPERSAGRSGPARVELVLEVSLTDPINWRNKAGMPGSPGGRGGQLILRIPLMPAAAVPGGRRDRAGARQAA